MMDVSVGSMFNVFLLAPFCVPTREQSQQKQRLLLALARGRDGINSCFSPDLILPKAPEQ